MDDRDHSNINKINEIFETMSYGQYSTSIAKALEWIESKQSEISAYIDSKTEILSEDIVALKNVANDETLCSVHIPPSSATDAILKKLGEDKNSWFEIPPAKRADIIYRLGTEIGNRQELFTELEIAARGILPQDTKKIFSILTDYFHYYSSFAVKHNAMNPSWKPEGIAVGIVTGLSPLSSFGAFLAPCLTAGYKVILQCPPQICLVAELLIDTSVQAGIPEGTIKLLPSEAHPEFFFLNRHVTIVSIFDDLYKDKFSTGNHFNKKLLHFYSSGIPMIVFDDSDIDSACHAVVDAAWGYKGMLPWSVRNILVQENILETFTEKLKKRLSKVKVASASTKNIDVSVPEAFVLKKLQELVGKAEKSGAEIFQPNETGVPVLLIGGNTLPNNVIKEDIVNVPVVTLTAFRTINEAVSLSNNTRQGLAVSVWTESSSVANEIARKLKVGNIWINSHGIFSANVSFTPYKSSGNGHLNGPAGFNEYVQLKPLTAESSSQTHNGNAMEKVIAEAKKAQDGWSKLSKFDRSKLLGVAAQKIQTNKNLGVNDTWVANWVTLIHDYASQANGATSSFVKNFNILSIKEPVGVVAVETLEDVETHNKRLIIAALAEGNAVIIQNAARAADAFYSFLSSIFVKGALTVISYSQEGAKIAALHKELDAYFGENSNNVFKSIPLKAARKFKVAKNDSWENVENQVVLFKNVWFNVGQSFI